MHARGEQEPARFGDPAFHVCAIARACACSRALALACESRKHVWFGLVRLYQGPTAEERQRKDEQRRVGALETGVAALRRAQSGGKRGKPSCQEARRVARATSSFRHTRTGTPRAPSEKHALATAQHPGGAHRQRAPREAPRPHLVRWTLYTCSPSTASLCTTKSASTAATGRGECGARPRVSQCPSTHAASSGASSVCAHMRTRQQQRRNTPRPRAPAKHSARSARSLFFSFSSFSSACHCIRACEHGRRRGLFRPGTRVFSHRMQLHASWMGVLRDAA